MDAQLGYSCISYRDRHLFYMVPLPPQEVTRAGLDGKSIRDETWVRVEFSTVWYCPVKAKGRSDDETSSWRMTKLVVRGVQFWHVDAPHHA
jgi:hypothetical protein